MEYTSPLMPQIRALNAFHAFLEDNEERAFVLAGMPGVGKTVFLQDCVNRFLVSDPNTSIVRIDAGEPRVRHDRGFVLASIVHQIQAACSQQTVQEWFKLFHQYRADQARLFQVDNPEDFLLLDEQRKEMAKNKARAIAEIEYLHLSLLRFELCEVVRTLGTQRLVIIIDTCDWFRLPAFQYRGSDLFLRILTPICEQLEREEKQCKIVLAGRLFPIYPLRDLEVGTEIELAMQQMELLPFDSVQANLYVQRAGVADRERCKMLYKVADGNPQALAFLTLFESKCVVPVNVDDLREQLAIGLLFPAILDDERLPSPFRELVLYGSLLDSFTLPLLRAIFPEQLPFGGGLLESFHALQLFDALTATPYLERVGPRTGTYRIRNPLREALRTFLWKRHSDQALLFQKRLEDYDNENQRG